MVFKPRHRLSLQSGVRKMSRWAMRNSGHSRQFRTRPRDGWMKFLSAEASHCSPCTVWLSAVSHKCRVANTNPPNSKASAVGMHVRSGG
jgi:hypothetical protein